MKRAFDVAVAIMLLIVTSPLWVLAAIAIKLTSPGPVFYRSTRVGRGGSQFTLLKFRTMTGGAGPRVTASSDVRITRAGQILRRLKIDELPQFLNVVAGDMSLVGPRPEDPRYVRGYTAEQRRVLTVRPGITSPAAIAYRDEQELMRNASDVESMYVNEILPAKLALDLEYVDRRSLLLDLVLIARTAAGIFFRPRRLR